MKEFDRITQGERVPDDDLSHKEAEMAWVGVVMERFVLEKDLEGRVYYSLNPEKAPEPKPFKWTPLLEEKPRRNPLQGEFILVRKYESRMMVMR